MTLITLNNQCVGPADWANAVNCDFKLNGKVHIWLVNVSDNLAYIDNFLNILNPEEVTRAGKYYRDSDRDRFIVSRGMLRHILAKYLGQTAADIKFRLIENNKPFVDQQAAPHLHFNLSDSADRVIIAIAEEAIGIDIELINANFGYKEIVNSNFNREEVAFIEQDESLKRFFLLWTRKEAILKATGIGLTDHLKAITSLDGEYDMDGDLLSTQKNWLLNSFDPGGNYIATIASEPGQHTYSFWNAAFSALK